MLLAQSAPAALCRFFAARASPSSQGAREQARYAVAAAVERLDQDRAEPREVVLTPQLVVRGSIAEPR
ncbi:hypothetical protein [Streptomyces sp. NPDC056464]|uniref:hypothetical protein n=1 Tax=Streptomyces sp. NPDC056464 TaxID=3345828 RepID=UPI0036C78B6F